jgi:hypothetical protein
MCLRLLFFQQMRFAWQDNWILVKFFYNNVLTSVFKHSFTMQVNILM